MKHFYSPFVLLPFSLPQFLVSAQICGKDSNMTGFAFLVLTPSLCLQVSWVRKCGWRRSWRPTRQSLSICAASSSMGEAGPSSHRYGEAAKHGFSSADAQNVKQCLPQGMKKSIFHANTQEPMKESTGADFTSEL